MTAAEQRTAAKKFAAVWRPLFEKGVHIDFARRTFRWDSEAALKAQVHCVIVGFSVASNEKPKAIYSNGRATDYVAIPKVSSDSRRYIPMDYLPSEVIAGDKLFVMPNATLYHFGVLTSNVHMAWTRAVCGRLGMGYRY